MTLLWTAMSYSMTFACEQPKYNPRVPTPPALVSALGTGARFSGKEVASWPTDPVHIHRHGASTRGIEIECRDAEMSVRMVSCTNEADWELAFATLELLGAATVEGEDGTRAAIANVRAAFAEVRSRELAAAASSIIAAVESGAALQLSGAVRDVYFGPRTAAEIRADPTGLLDRIRRIQYIEDEGFEIVKYSNLSMMMALTVEFGFSIWSPEKAEAFTPTSWVGMKGPTSLHIKLAALPDLCGSRFEWLDEKQFTIAATPEPELPALFERAKRVAFNPYRKLGKKWWQFWR